MEQFNNAADPILKLLDSYFNKKKTMNNNIVVGETMMQHIAPEEMSLPDYPVTFVRDTKGRVSNIVYGYVEELENIEEGEECSVVIWQEELIRDSKGKVIQIIKTYPDGSTDEIDIVRGNDNKVIGLEVSN